MQGVQLYIEVGDKDGSNPDDLIDQFVVEIPPTLSIGDVINSTTYNGIRGFSQIDLTIEVVCDVDYTGDRCERSIVGCNPGFTGQSCETDIDDCIGVDCNGNGQCIDGNNTYSCICNVNYTGEQCETKLNIDNCLGIKCSGKGQCRNGFNNFTCDCKPGYSGRLCQIKNKSSDTQMNNNETIEGKACNATHYSMH